MTALAMACYNGQLASAKPRVAKAKLYWLLEFTTFTLAVVLLCVWILDLTVGSNNLSPSFSKVGFCISPSEPTHQYCFMFDTLGGCIFLLLPLFKFPLTKCIALAVYCFSHGGAHYFLSLEHSTDPVTNTIHEESPLARIAGIITLASILSIGWVFDHFHALTRVNPGLKRLVWWILL